ncbi:hypothetical protein WDW37_17980 [Bdellovibrionota bacterium FG-1]
MRWTTRWTNRLNRCVLGFLLLALSFQTVLAAGPDTPAPVEAPYTSEMIGAKALLEDMLAKRYRTGLATLLDRESFTVSAQVEIEPIRQPQPTEDKAPPPDIMLGTFELDRLEFKPPEGLLNKYEIVSAVLSVGLIDTLDKATEEQVGTWLKQRVKNEFQETGKSSVTFIKKKPVDPTPPPEKPLPPREKTPLDRVAEMQTLLGLTVFSLAILLALLGWKNMVSKDALEERKTTVELHKLQSPALTAEAPPPPKKIEEEKTPEPIHHTRSPRQIQAEINGFLDKIRTLVTQLGPRLEPIMATWTQAGEEGTFKMACFIDAVTEMQEHFNVPAEARNGMIDVFKRMSEFPLLDRLQTVEKVYWDVVAFKTLGAEGMEKPFEYLGRSNGGLLNEMLINENSRMRTLVALHMPEQTRTQYFGTLSPDSLEELIEEAFKLDKVSKTDVQALNNSLKSKFNGTAAEAEIQVQPMLARLLESLKPTAEIAILRKLEERLGSAMTSFKENYPSLAFVGWWSDAALTSLFATAPQGEIASFLRLIPEVKGRVLAVCPPMTRQIVEDGLKREDRTTADERENHLLSLKGRLNELLANGQIDLHLETANEKTRENVRPMAA